MIFGHSPEEIRKALAAAVVSIAALVGFFVAVDPNTVETVVALIGAGVNVAAVYATRNDRPTSVGATRID